MITWAALAVCMLSIGVCTTALYQLRHGWKLVRERETLADAYDKVLQHREQGLRQREKALWWADKERALHGAERGRQWVR